MADKTIIIAEAGVNHNGSFDLAVKLIQEAKRAGADYVKFQTFVPELIVSTFAPKAEYQKETTDKNESQLNMLRSLMLPPEDFKRLKEICDETGIGFMSTPFDFKSIEVLTPLNMDYIKIPSGEITNLPYLRRIAKMNAPVIMSTGMSNLDEIADAMQILEKEGVSKENIILLHCNTQYPTPFEDVNLNAMHTIAQRFGVTVGYSDHTRGIEVPIAAVAMGAKVIEKHFTLSRSMEGPDHRASLEPDELKAMVDAIRNVEKAVGSGEKHATPSESGNKAVARKSITAARDIKKGELLTEENLTVKRPGNGISPMKWDSVIGTKAVRDFCYDELIEL